MRNAASDREEGMTKWWCGAKLCMRKMNANESEWVTVTDECDSDSDSDSSRVVDASRWWRVSQSQCWTERGHWRHYVVVLQQTLLSHLVNITSVWQWWGRRGQSTQRPVLPSRCDRRKRKAIYGWWWCYVVITSEKQLYSQRLCLTKAITTTTIIIEQEKVKLWFDDRKWERENQN